MSDGWGSGTFDLNFENSSLFGSSEDDRVRSVLTLLYAKNTTEALDVLEAMRGEIGATPLVLHLLALAICRTERIVPAIRLLTMAHEQSPDTYEHAEVLATLLAVAGHRLEAVYYAKLATALSPGYPQFELVPKWLIRFGAALLLAEENPLADRGYGLLRDGALLKAAETFIDAVDLDRDNAQAWRGLIEVSRLRRRPGDALRAAEALVAIKGDEAQDLLRLARCQIGVGDIDTAWKTVQSALAASEGDIDMAQALVNMLRYDQSAPVTLQKTLSDAWNALANRSPVSVNIVQRKSDTERFRVGILSGAMLGRSDRTALLATIEEAIGRAADIYYYSNTDLEDSVSRRLRRSAINWCIIQDVDDETVATIMQNDEIQILLDLDGFDWTGRPGVVALKPAPVVLSVFGTPGCVPGTSVGVLALGEPELPGFSGAPDGAVLLPMAISTWPLYADIRKSAEAAPPEDTRTGPVRILIDAPAACISSEFLAVLANAVRHGMQGVLVLRSDDPEDSQASDILSERFTAAGLNLATVERVPHKTALENIIEDIDIVLDSFPIPSLEPTIVALRHGKPVLTLQPGRSMNGSVSSLLRSLGLEDWIAVDSDAMARALARIVGDPETLRRAHVRIFESISAAATVETRNRRGRAFAELFDRLLAEAAGDRK